MSYARRSGAQRGALENNFGQRFSWAPLAFNFPQPGLALPLLGRGEFVANVKSRPPK